MEFHEIWYGCTNYIEHTLDNIKNYKFSYIVTFEEMKQKLGNIYKTKFQHIVQNPKKYYKKDFY
ncbi:hypothetical protein PFMC_00908 [Plasmodium falciparum CAMP/Malaysia]|uniref:Plasmodium RESA N-terminal domain-containing protein n=1 Tax=Plasmodium falciparum (isolate Camp / Malaysia) TaxID=5835 RepID=A0A024XCH0_PLAFC|nr:hypothetical protein PFMC_00908 [Plasmodium falciparum CAMP/Malaysia]